VDISSQLQITPKKTMPKKEDLTLEVGDEIIYRGYSAILQELIIDEENKRFWRIKYMNDEEAVVKANLVKKERSQPIVFNPRHKDGFFDDEYDGHYNHHTSL
tara:strand:+ start:1066 stop:1371 length:306 start_codon:yes stop_codon:yes gene_type:complete